MSPFRITWKRVESCVVVKYVYFSSIIMVSIRSSLLFKIFPFCTTTHTFLELRRTFVPTTTGRAKLLEAPEGNGNVLSGVKKNPGRFEM